MGRLLAIDHGRKRTGLAVTDPLQIIATPLDTVRTHSLSSYLKEYFSKESVDEIIIGLPQKLDNTDTDVTAEVRRLSEKLKNEFPGKPIHLHDEKFTSKIAFETMLAAGVKKKDRRKKENIDKISATIILQSFLQFRKK